MASRKPTQLRLGHEDRDSLDQKMESRVPVWVFNSALALIGGLMLLLWNYICRVDEKRQDLKDSIIRLETKVDQLERLRKR